MKKTIAIISLCVYIYSCKPDVPSQPSTPAYLSSINQTSSQYRLVDSFQYDTSHHITALFRYIYDTTQGPPILDSGSAVFSFQPNAAVPDGYLYNDLYEGYYNVSHQLTYDGQNRIIKDTAIGGSGFVTYYTYSAGLIAANTYNNGTFDDQSDSLFFTNGNLSEERVYYNNYTQTADSLAGDIHYSYGSHTSPAYHSEEAVTVGPLIHTMEYAGGVMNADPISPNIPSSFSGTGGGLIPGTFTVNLTTNPQGRITAAALSYSGISLNGKAIYTYY
jgi:hypothetical protein